MEFDIEREKKKDTLALPEDFALLVWRLARRWQHPAMLWPPLISIVSTFMFADMLHPMMDRDVLWLGSLTQCRSLGWLGACSLPLLSTFIHTEPVNRGIPGSAHESTADQQNHSWHILAVNTKHNLTNSRLGKWKRRCQPSRNTQVDKYTQTFKWLLKLCNSLEVKVVVLLLDIDSRGLFLFVYAGGGCSSAPVGPVIWFPLLQRPQSELMSKECMQ